LQIASVTIPDLILLDMLLPKLGGVEVLQALRKNPVTASIPVIVLSSLPQKNEAKLIKEGAAALLMLASLGLYSQEKNFRNFGTAEGLNNLAVRQLYQDRIGFIWVSTENGILRYDGKRLEAFGPEQGIPSTSGAGFGDAPNGSLLVGGTCLP
jgi:CheY-like chemotaxis protein